IAVGGEPYCAAVGRRVEPAGDGGQRQSLGPLKIAPIFLPHMRQDHIRNFCIVAHIDHGKSTLADRLIELTGTLDKRLMREQVLDTMDLERERGITIKLNAVRLNYHARDGGVHELIGSKPEEILRISAKEGSNVPELLEAVVRRIPPPRGVADAPLRALIFDSYYDRYRGAIPSIRVVDGTIRPGMKIAFGAHKDDVYEVDEVGYL